MAENIEETDIFTKQGHFKDEVILEFDDGKSLFVSQGFLVLASPVFEAMFSGEYKEKQEGKVKLDGKKYEDILEFLQCLNPRSEKSVDESNLLQVTPLADKYQVGSMIKMCQQLMMKRLRRLSKDTAQRRKVQESNLEDILKIIALAAQLNYSTLRDCACEVLAGYPSGHYVAYKNISVPWTDSCQKLFSSLPWEWKYTIVINRLEKCENNKLYF